MNTLKLGNSESFRLRIDSLKKLDAGALAEIEKGGTGK